MQLLLLLSAIASIAKLTAAECDACLQSQCYTKAIVHDGDISGQMAVDRNTNDLFYQYEDAKGEYIQVANNLDTGIKKTLPYIADYLPKVAIDQSTKDVYLGSSRGLYVYNSVRKTTKFLGLSSYSIDQLEFKDRLYFSGILYGLYFIQDGDVYVYTALRYEAVDDYVIDKNDDIYYTGQHNFWCRNFKT